MIRSDSATTLRGTLAVGEDGERIGRLAIASRSRPPEGPILLAEVDGDPVAAVGIFDRHMIADPARSAIALRLRLHLVRMGLRLVVAVYGL